MALRYFTSEEPSTMISWPGGNMEQSEKTKPTVTSSYNISPTGGNPRVNHDTFQRVTEVLYQNTSIDTKDIVVNVDDRDRVELTGYVPSEEMISLASHCLKDLGISSFRNSLTLYPG